MDYAWLPLQPRAPEIDLNQTMNTVHAIVYEACVLGHMRVLCTTLNSLPEATRRSFVEYEMKFLNGERRTPLIAAAMNGRSFVVKALIEEYDAEVDHAGRVMFDDALVKNVTPLWCASATGRLGIVKILVRFGADVNAFTTQHSTPLRAACYDGRVDIIDYLVRHGANMRATNIFDSDCLMLAAYKGKLDAVVYFVERGVSVNETARCGSTPLFFACQSGHVGVVQYLVSNGACFTSNNEGKSPLMIAAEYTRELVVLFLLYDETCRLNLGITPNVMIDALELLGASFASDKDNYDLSKSFMYLEQAMRLRYADYDIIHKPVTPTIPAFDNWVESRSLGELASRRYDRDAMHMEALTIRERILGPKSLTVANGAIFRGAVYADQTRFDRCIDLWLHALRIRISAKVFVAADIQRFVELFNRLLFSTVNGERDLNLAVIKEVLEAATNELDSSLHMIGNTAIDDLMNSCFMLLVHITYLLTQKETDEFVFDMKQSVYKLIKLNPTTSSKKTFLHLASCYKQESSSELLRNFKFPNSDLFSLLLECGSDVNAVDLHKNTPLHLLVTYPRPLRHLLKLISMVNMLVQYGAHVDAVNSDGDTPMTKVDEAMTEALFGRHTLLSLKCLSAAAASDILQPCPCNKIPKSLVQFTELHSQKTFRHLHKDPRRRTKTI